MSAALKRRSEDIRNKLKPIQDKVNSVELPERFKGTVVEKWVGYWKQLGRDYTDVALDVCRQAKERPLKASVIGTGLGSIYYLAKHNPDESDFIEQLRENNTKLYLVHEEAMNPKTKEYMKFIHAAYNQGIIRKISIGIGSFLWLADYDKGLALYKSTCSYLGPEYLTFYQRIIDVGFLDTWWVLEGSMKDYDINV